MKKQVDNGAYEKNSNKKVKAIVITAVVLLIILVIISIRAYARYIERQNSVSEVSIAEPICTLHVEPSEASKKIVNPYCVVTVRNYDNSNKVTETDMNYRIEVTANQDIELPPYYWEDENGTVVAYSTDLTGTIPLKGNVGHAEKEEHKYKIVFKNPGDKDIIYKVDFNLVATQKGDRSI